AADMAAGERKVLAQEIDQRLARFDGLMNGLAIHHQRDVAAMLAHDRASASRFATRRSSTPARCFFTAPVACTSSGGLRSLPRVCTASSSEAPASAASALLARCGVVPTPK